MRVLVVNAGSSSLKLSALGPDDATIFDQTVPRTRGEADAPALRAALDSVPDVDAVGHRVVHGGAIFERAVVLDARRERELHELADLAPLHNAPALAAVAATQAWRPEIPQVACFDTEFHTTMPAAATQYALPQEWRDWGLRRFGFHGLSHAYATRRAAHVLGRPPEDLRLVSAHLGAGASLAAVAHGRSVDTTMGFTPLEGLVMATRSGSIDPGALLWVMRHRALSVDQVEEVLERGSGLLGLSGTSADMRAVITAADDGDARAALAVDVYGHRLRALVAAMVAAMDGIDGLVFTGGVGEGSARVRRDACAGLGFLGIRMDEVLNDAPVDDPGSGSDRVVSPPGASPAVVVVHAREDLEIARQVRSVVGARR
ncbi:MAG TPA: acetate/propionate family kinase [Acidimicrobiales bacterium]|nr:acetate/propionate family kinase [Acidimicrobiales bacterium]